MARSNTGSSSNYFTGGQPVSAYPLTLACWANLANATHTASVLNVSNAGGDIYASIAADGNNEYGGTDNAIVADSSSGAAKTSTQFSANTWFHACGVFASATSRAAYLNGGGKGTNTANAGPFPTTNTISLGAFKGTSSGVFGPTNGRIAEAAIWNVALTDEEVLQLGKGFSPILVRPDALVAYYPLIGRQSPEQDKVGGLHLTTVGTMAQAEHVSLVRPSSPMYFPFAAAVGGGTVGGLLSGKLIRGGLLGGRLVR